MMAMLPSSWSRWSAKQYIVAVLLGGLVTVALATVISIILAPAHISFSVASPGMPVMREEEGEMRMRKGKYYSFTLVANNPSRRMWVSYGDYLNAEIWPTATAWIPGHVSLSEVDTLQRWQPPGQAINVTVLAESWQFDQTTHAPAQDMVAHNANCTVVVNAEVRFKLGLARTMPYTVTATCLRVNFINNTDEFPVQCW